MSNSPSQIKAIIVDLDGTISDAKAWPTAVCQAIEKAMKSRGFPANPKTFTGYMREVDSLITKHKSIGLDNCVEIYNKAQDRAASTGRYVSGFAGAVYSLELLARDPDFKSQVRELAAECYDDVLATMPDAIRVGNVAAVKAAKRDGVLIAAATNGSGEIPLKTLHAADLFLQGEDISGVEDAVVIDTLVSGNDFPGGSKAYKKPNTHLFDTAVERLGVSRSEVMVIGDTTGDIFAAFRANLGLSVLSSNNQQNHHPVELGTDGFGGVLRPDVVVDRHGMSPEVLNAIIEAHENPRLDLEAGLRGVSSRGVTAYEQGERDAATLELRTGAAV